VNDTRKEKPGKGAAAAGKPEKPADGDTDGKRGGESGTAAQKPDEKKTASRTDRRPARRGGSGSARPAHAPRGRRSAAAGRYLLLALLAVNALLVAGGAYLWQQQLGIADEARERIARLGDEQQRLARRLDDQRRALEERVAKLRETQQGLGEDLAALLERSGHLRNDWMIAEAEYLIRLANHRLLLDRDVDTALAALATADARLRDTGDPALIPARKALAEDMAALRALPRVDRTGLSLQLSALARQAAALPLATPTPERLAAAGEPDAAPETPAAEGAPAEADRPWWASLTEAWEILRGLIVIRQHDDPVQPLIPPEQRFFLTQNLVLQLEQARIALLRGEADIYRERVAQARAWVARYFDGADPAVVEALARLKDLAGRDIAPPLPEITRGLAAIARYRARRAGTPAPASPQAAAPKPEPKSPPKAKPKPAPRPAPAPTSTTPPAGAAVEPATTGGGS